MPFFIFTALLGFVIWIFVIQPRMKKTSFIFSEQHKTILKEKVVFYRKLSPSQQVVFEKDIIHFLENYLITGVGYTLSDEDKILVASSAVIPIFGFPKWKYKNLNEVLVYPNAFDHDYGTKGEGRNIAGMVGWGALNRTMILSRTSLHQGFENEHSKSNVGIHEFVHLIDKSDGAIDGVPEVIMNRQYTIPWLKMIHQEMKEIHKHHSDINPYALVNESEFLSVVSEYFFNQPELLEKNHPDLYEVLKNIFHQDVAHPGTRSTM